jgi:hypothetical protein
LRPEEGLPRQFGLQCVRRSFEFDLLLAETAGLPFF